MLTSRLVDAMVGICWFPVDGAVAENVLGLALFSVGRTLDAGESLTIRGWIRTRSCQFSAPTIRAAAPARTNPSGSAHIARRAARATRAAPGSRRERLGERHRPGRRLRCEQRDPE